MVDLERLFHKVFVIEEYNNLVRPETQDGLTRVETELKLLQIDLVKYYNSEF